MKHIRLRKMKLNRVYKDGDGKCYRLICINYFPDRISYTIVHSSGISYTLSDGNLKFYEVFKYGK